jgi:glycogen debranching enzyme
MRRPPDAALAPADQEIVAGPGTITAINGLTFVISDELGEIDHGLTGLISNDTRHLSVMTLLVGGIAPERLGAAVLSPDRASFHTFLPSPRGDAALECSRLRRVQPQGFAEDVVLRWWAPGSAAVDVELAFGCDFADIFAVRRPAQRPGPQAQVEWDGDLLTLRSVDGMLATRIRFSQAPHHAAGPTAHWQAEITRLEPWSLSLAVEAEPRAASPTVVLGSPPADEAGATLSSEPDEIEQACQRSLADLQRLTIADSADPPRRLLTAGIPWFVALFGRDSLIASYQARAFAPGRLLDTLHGLAARQGTTVDPANDEEPGKILHEVRLTGRPWLGEGTERGSRPYYGSIDVTPLFLIMLGVAWRWGADSAEIRALLPAAMRAVEWMRRFGDRDGDGLIEYRAGGPRSLRNQGWKDSEDAIQFADGTLAEGAIAVVEVQGYAYRARRELADVLRWLGEDAEADELALEADLVRREIRERFWIPDGSSGGGYFALALDGDKRPVDAVASNMGHLLWCGVPSNEEAEQVAERLVHPDMACGWGVRTLSRAMAGYNPISYHLGSVWPHDTALICEGLRRYALDREALSLIEDLMAAVTAFGGRLPELFAGHDRVEQPLPVPYPTACRPQAWSAGVPLALIPMLLGLEPSIPRRSVALDPLLPAGVGRITLTGIAFASGDRLSLEIGDGGTRLFETSPGLSVEMRPARRIERI